MKYRLNSLSRNRRDQREREERERRGNVVREVEQEGIRGSSTWKFLGLAAPERVKIDGRENRVCHGSQFRVQRGRTFF